MTLPPTAKRAPHPAGRAQQPPAEARPALRAANHRDHGGRGEERRLAMGGRVIQTPLSISCMGNH